MINKVISFYGGFIFIGSVYDSEFKEFIEIDEIEFIALKFQAGSTSGNRTETMEIKVK